MAARLRHRGPDDTGLFADEDVGLAHARLAIIDPAHGAQPIHNEDRTVRIVFNGEIFNYVELREQLLALGHSFGTLTDTEVIVHLYEEYGDGFVHRLNGQFAFALWDATRRRLLLVRDRAGILPLYYTLDGGRLIFASEIKAMAPVRRESVRLDPDGLDQCLTFWSATGRDTVFSGVSQVLPGGMLVASGGQVREHRYWDWSFPEDGEFLDAPEAEQAGELRALLEDATRIRLRADVPVGAYLSGGLDSSVIVALVRRVAPAELRTFSIGFDDPDFDESSWQRELIEHAGVTHSRVRCAGRDIASGFLAAIAHGETPILRAAPVPMRRLSAHVHEQGFRVVLTGEGADEVLGGYDIFKEDKIRRFWAQRPDSRWRPLLLKRLYPYLTLPRGDASAAYLSAFFGQGLDDPGQAGFSHLPRWSMTRGIREFLAPDFRARTQDGSIERFRAGLPAAFHRWHPFNQAQYIEATTLMPGYILSSQGDRMLMSNSVEGRFPFLDHRVMEFAARIRPELKMKVLREKYLLKRAARDLVPRSILARPKQPYRAPDISAFFGADEPEYVRELLDARALKESGYFDVKKVGMLMRKIRAGRASGIRDGMAFMAILSTQAWHHLFAGGNDWRQQ